VKNEKMLKIKKNLKKKKTMMMTTKKKKVKVQDILDHKLMEMLRSYLENFLIVLLFLEY